MMKSINGKSNPVMPKVPISLLPDIFQTLQNASKARADYLDFAFFRDVLSQETCPEYNGYNTSMCRQQGHVLRPKTKVVYLPLIDRPPADSGTMMTSMLKAKKVAEGVGQEYVIFTADQQLYRVALHVQWEQPEIFQNVYLRLGGMHFLMSYIGCIGNLMAETGMEDILSVPFGGVLKMLSGKKFPENVRALRMLVEELLRPVFSNHSLESMDALRDVLNDIRQKSRTACLWIDCLIKPVMILLTFIRAERESDWPLHMQAVDEMIVLFFAAGHPNYARHGLYYKRCMEAMPEQVLCHFLRGEHTFHHTAGLFNGIWTDMAIETTYMRYGHGGSGIIGITLKPETLKTWAYSLHTCNGLVVDLNEMREKETPAKTQHKEEMPGRIITDKADRQALRQKLTSSIDPLDPHQHPDEG